MPAWTSATIALKGAWAAAIGAVMLALAVFGGVQTVRLHGFHLWPLSVTGWIRTAEDRAAERDAEIRAHRATKENYRAAQAIAAQLERDRLAKVQAQQETIRHATAQDHARRIGALRERAERLRREAATRSGAAGAGGAGDLPGLSAAGGGAAEAPGDPRLPAALGRTADEQLARDLIASEQAEQLEALIAFVTAQAAIDPNAD